MKVRRRGVISLLLQRLLQIQVCFLAEALFTLFFLFKLPFESRHCTRLNIPTSSFNTMNVLTVSFDTIGRVERGGLKNGKKSVENVLQSNVSFYDVYACKNNTFICTAFRI